MSEIVNLPPDGLFGVPKELIPADLYAMLVRAKTKDFQMDAQRRDFVVWQLMRIRGYSREIAENYYDRIVCDWMTA